VFGIGKAVSGIEREKFPAQNFTIFDERAEACFHARHAVIHVTSARAKTH
jgi:hypothetical protein